jgi:predicted ATP-binding protein involved in virulence
VISLRLDNLVLQNFRCFAGCDIAFHPGLTVLVAENGNGKTALLDATSLALSAYVNMIFPEERLKKIDRTDVRLTLDDANAMHPSLPTRISASGIVGDEPVQWEAAVKEYGPKVRQSSSDFKALQRASEHLRHEDALLPLVAFYGTGRLWSEHRLAEGRRTSLTDVNQRLTAYSDCLASSSSFKGVSSWYEYRAKEVAAPAYKESLGTNIALLTAVREAARTVLEPTGWSNLDWDTELKSLVAEHPQHGRLPLSSLSDGVRNMLALVGDVARRCASLNPHLSGDAARLTPGVLLIDEVDMHLHPRWQQVVVELLRSAFPSVQMVLTTHSPHVLSTVDRESIRVLRVVDGTIVADTPHLQTRGVMSADVLASIMGVDPVPQVDEASWLSRYRAIIEDGEAEGKEGQELRQRLVSHFGDTHPLIADCDRLIRFQAFRVKKQSLGES